MYVLAHINFAYKSRLLLKIWSYLVLSISRFDFSIIDTHGQVLYDGLGSWNPKAPHNWNGEVDTLSKPL